MLKIKRKRPGALFYEITEPARDEVLRWANRTEEERRQRRAPIDHDIFRSGPIVDAVVEDFQGRCAYCERYIGHSEGIGHFRPLSIGYRKNDDQFADHYAWLAFEWLNLFLLCRRCQKAKANRFPVAGSRRARFLATFDEVRDEEKPYLLDPTIDNPSLHISYLISGECIPRRKSQKSITTIDILELNDQSLVFDRRASIGDTLSILRAALQSRTPLPSDFLLNGPFLGARREIVVRILTEFRPVTLSINNGRVIRKHLDDMLAHASELELRRINTIIERLFESDRIRNEADGEQAPSVSYRTVPDFLATEANRPFLSKGEMAFLRISNVRAIDHIEIPFPELRSRKAGAPCLLLLGENAVGKSTCLSSMALALLGTREAKKLRLSYRDLARSIDRASWNVWGKAPLEVTIGFHNKRQSAKFHYDPTRDELEGTEEQSTVVIGYGPHRYFANARGQRGTASFDRVRSLFDPRKPLPDPSEWLESLEGQAFDQVARTIHTILPTGDDDHLVNDPRMGICVLAQGQLTPVTHLSEGYRAMFAMVTDICRSLLDYWVNLETAEAVVLIDEIETHLHPRWKMRVMSSLRKAFPNVQFIATTHDPLCVRGMDDGEVVVLARDATGGVHVLDDLPPISGMRAEQILTSEYFGLSSTVDPEVHLEIARLAEGAQINSKRDIGAEASELVSKLTLGNSAAAQIIHTALQQYLREREPTAGSVAPNTRGEAVAAVLQALRASKMG